MWWEVALWWRKVMGRLRSDDPGVVRLDVVVMLRGVARSREDLESRKGRNTESAMVVIVAVRTRPASYQGGSLICL